MSKKQYVFKRRFDREIMFIILLFVLFPLLFSIAAVSILFSPGNHPEATTDSIGLFITSAFFSIPLILWFLQQKSQQVIITDEKIVLNRMFGSVSLHWNEVFDIEHYRGSMNGILTRETLRIQNQEKKNIIELGIRSFKGDGDIVEVLMGIFEQKSDQRAESIKKMLSQQSDKTYTASLFMKSVISIFPVVFVVIMLVDIFILNEEYKWWEMLLGTVAVISGIGLLGYYRILPILTSRYILTKDALVYRSIFKGKEIVIPYAAIEHIECANTCGIVSIKLALSDHGEFKTPRELFSNITKLRNIQFINSKKLSDDLSLRRQAALLDRPTSH